MLKTLSCILGNFERTNFESLEPYSYHNKLNQRQWDRAILRQTTSFKTCNRRVKHIINNKISTWCRIVLWDSRIRAQKSNRSSSAKASQTNNSLVSNTIVIPMITSRGALAPRKTTVFHTTFRGLLRCSSNRTPTCSTPRPPRPWRLSTTQLLLCPTIWLATDLRPSSSISYTRSRKMERSHFSTIRAREDSVSWRL